MQIKKATYIFRTTLRGLLRIIIETFHRLLLNLPDTLFGFLKWPEKKLRIKIFILPTAGQSPPISAADLDKAIAYATDVFRKRFNVRLLPVQKNEPFAEMVKAIPPHAALYTKGGSGALTEEFKEAGDFFSRNLVSPVYPITVFVVITLTGATGCSLGPMTDYVTLDHDGAKDISVLAHELAHACGLWHVKDKTNLLWNTNKRGSAVSWWQKNIFRSSRHITYW